MKSIFRSFIALLVGLCLLAGSFGTVRGADTGDDLDYDRLLARKNQVYDPGSAELYPAEGMAIHETARYTFMVYMTGSNLESKYASATKDILEMTGSGIDLSDVNLILYTGGAQTWKSKIPSGSNSVIDLSLPREDYVVASTASNADMGAWETLQKFINFTTTYYPAEHYALVFWDHGGGPLWGYGSDELFESDSLLMDEMKNAMNGTIFSGRTKLDLVGFDACLMGSYEVMNLWSRYAKYYVGSEELEPGDGWDYHFLGLLNETEDPETIGRSIVDHYGAYYDSARSETYDPDTTLSLIDLSSIKAFSRSLDTLFSRMAAGIQEGDLSILQSGRLDAKTFGMVESRSSGLYSYDLVDLPDLLSHLSSIYPEEAGACLSLLPDLVLHQASSVPQAGGLTLYYPVYNKGQYEKLKDSYRKYAPASYRKFLDILTAGWLDSKTRDWSLGEMIRSGDEYQLALTEEQSSQLAFAYYNVLQDLGAGLYQPVLQEVRIRPDFDDVLHVPLDPFVFCLDGEGASSEIWPMIQLEQNAKRESYRTIGTSLISDQNPFLRIMDTETQRISALVVVDPESGALTLSTVTSSGEEAELGSKDTVDTSTWEGIYYSFDTTVPSRDLSGRLLPFHQWDENTSLTNMVILPFDGQFTFSRHPISGFAGDYVLQLVIEDLNGERYATELSRASSLYYYEQAVPTEGGRMTFRIFEDHAELSRYAGQDLVLTIPEEVDGLPVTVLGTGCFSSFILGDDDTLPVFESVTLPSTLTEIGTQAFYGCDTLKEITIPERVTSIGASAFAGCTSLTEVILPESVRKIGKACFDSCESLTAVHLPSKLDSISSGIFTGCLSLEAVEGDALRGYRIQDGALYDESGKRLLCVPAAREGSFTLPAGTQAIACGAFYRTSLTEVILPEGLKSIDSYAFFGAMNLSAPVFPESLETIGQQAFGADAGTLAYPEKSGVPVIRIPKNLSAIGSGAFDLFPVKTFEVSEENPSYAESGGHLCGKAGDTILSFATDASRVYEIPEGVSSFDWSLMDHRLDLAVTYPYPKTHLVFPESVARISGEIPLDSSNFVFHAPIGSYAQQYAEENGIAWDTETPFYTIARVPTEKGILYARIYDDHASIVLYLGEDESLTIPDTVEGKPVTVIGGGEDPIEYVSYGSYTGLDIDRSTLVTKPLQHLTLPDTVTVLSRKALKNSFEASADLVLPNLLKVIADDALPAHKGDGVFTLPEHLVYIGRHLPSQISAIPVSTDLTYISPQALDCRPSSAGFIQLEENETYLVRDGALLSKDGKTLILLPSAPAGETLILPGGVTQIGPYAVTGGFFSRLEIPYGYKEIDEHAFEGSSRLTELVLPDSLQVIGSYAFASCSALEKAEIPSCVRRIEDHAFSNDKILSEVRFSEGLAYIGDQAFAYTKITRISLPSTITYLGEKLFYRVTEVNLSDAAMSGTEGLTLVLGPDLAYIGDGAFAHLEVTSFEVHPENRIFSSREGLLYDRAGRVLLAVPPLIQEELSIPGGTTLLGDGSLTGCRILRQVMIPPSVLAISPYAFPYRCTYLLLVPEGSRLEEYALINRIEYQTYPIQ